MKNKQIPSTSTIILIIALIGITVLGVWWFWFRPAEEIQSPTVNTIRLKSGNLVISANGEGVLEQTTLSLGFPIPGSLVQIAEPGQVVRSGELLASLDSQKAELDLQKAELTWQTLTSSAELAALKSEEMEASNNLADIQQKYTEILNGPDLGYYKTLLANAEQAYWDASHNLAEARMLAEKDKRIAASLPRLKNQLTAAENALEQARLDLDWALNYQTDPNELLLADGKIQAAQSTLNIKTNSLTALQQNPDLLAFSTNAPADILPLQKAWAGLEQARLVLAASHLSAPFNGTVAQVNAQDGELLSSNQPILALIADAPFTIRFTLDERDLRYLSIGDTFTAAPAAYPNLELTGQITAIAPAINTGAQITVWGQILPNDLVVKLLPGMNLDVTVHLAESRDAFILPQQAIQYDPAGQPFVNQVMADGSFQAIPVTLGLSDYTSVVITGELKPGDLVSIQPTTK
jgi:multidrug efflux pump subunit AcrA (membrane-fusion protein)